MFAQDGFEILGSGTPPVMSGTTSMSPCPATIMS
jgi:hypothetical protein